MRYSFIVPSIRCDDFLIKCINEILNIKRDDYEIIVCLFEFDEKLKFEKTKIVKSDFKNTSIQRNIASENANGEVLVFIDSDSYPEVNFLDILDNDFFIENLNFVGGPNVTPKENSLFQKASGFSMALIYPERHYPYGVKRKINFIPSVNFSIKRNFYFEIKGFNSFFNRTSEDVDLCFRYIDRFKDMLTYNPGLIVNHNRRKDFIGLLKQYFVYGYDIYKLFVSDFNIMLKNNIDLKSIYFMILFMSIFVGLAFSFVFFGIFFILFVYFLSYFILFIYSLIFLKKYEKNILVISFGVFLFPFVIFSYVAGFYWAFISSFFKKIRKQSV